MDEVKICKACKKEKDISEFRIVKSGGREARYRLNKCKECNSKKQKERNKKLKKIKEHVVLEVKMCKSCKIEYTLDNFQKNYDKRDKKYYYRSVCKNCYNAKMKLKKKDRFSVYELLEREGVYCDKNQRT
jgi:hypothetical protein